MTNDTTPHSDPEVTPDTAEIPTVRAARTSTRYTPKHRAAKGHPRRWFDVPPVVDLREETPAIELDPPIQAKPSPTPPQDPSPTSVPAAQIGIGARSDDNPFRRHLGDTTEFREFHPGVPPSTNPKRRRRSGLLALGLGSVLLAGTIAIKSGDSTRSPQRAAETTSAQSTTSTSSIPGVAQLETVSVSQRLLAGGPDLLGNGTEAQKALLRRPVSVSRVAAGVLVSDAGTLRLVRPDGRIEAVPVPGLPVGFAIDQVASVDSKDVLVTDTRSNRLVRVRGVGTPVVQAEAVPALGILRPTAVVGDGLGGAFITDAGSGSLWAWSPASGTKRVANGFVAPVAVSLAGTQPLVTDRALGAVFVVNRDGSTSALLAEQNYRSRPNDTVTRTLTTPLAAVGIDERSMAVLLIDGSVVRAPLNPSGRDFPVGVAKSSLTGPSALVADPVSPTKPLVVESGLRRVSTVSVTGAEAGTVTAVAGATGWPRSNPDAVRAKEVTLIDPSGMSSAPDGSLVVADRGANIIWRLKPDGSASRLAGSGDWGVSPDGSRANLAAVASPTDVAVAPDGRVLFTEPLLAQIREIGKDGVLRTLSRAKTLDPQQPTLDIADDPLSTPGTSTTDIFGNSVLTPPPPEPGAVMSRPVVKPATKPAAKPAVAVTRKPGAKRFGLTLLRSQAIITPVRRPAPEGSANSSTTLPSGSVVPAGAVVPSGSVSPAASLPRADEPVTTLASPVTVPSANTIASSGGPVASAVADTLPVAESPVTEAPVFSSASPTTKAPKKTKPRRTAPQTTSPVSQVTDPALEPTAATPTVAVTTRNQQQNSDPRSRSVTPTTLAPATTAVQKSTPTNSAATNSAVTNSAVNKSTPTKATTSKSPEAKPVPLQPPTSKPASAQRPSSQPARPETKPDSATPATASNRQNGTSDAKAAIAKSLQQDPTGTTPKLYAPGPMAVAGNDTIIVGDRFVGGLWVVSDTGTRMVAPDPGQAATRYLYVSREQRGTVIAGDAQGAAVRVDAKGRIVARTKGLLKPQSQIRAGTADSSGGLTLAVEGVDATDDLVDVDGFAARRKTAVDGHPAYEVSVLTGGSRGDFAAIVGTRAAVERIGDNDHEVLTSIIAGADSSRANQTPLDDPTAIDVQPDGTVLIADRGGARVRSLVNGTLTAVAGSGSTETNRDPKANALQRSLDDLRDVVQSRSGLVILANGDTLLSIDGTGLVTETTVTDTDGRSMNLRAIAEAADSAIVAVDASGRLLRIEKRVVSVLAAKPTLGHIRVDKLGTIWAVSKSSQLLKLVGETFEVVPTPQNIDVVASDERDGVLVLVGRDGTVIRKKDDVWKRLLPTTKAGNDRRTATPVPPRPTDIALMEDGAVLVSDAGRDAVLVYREL